MKKIIFSLFIAALVIFFTACTNKFFPKKVVYNISAPGSPAISPDLMRAECYRNNITFYNEGKLSAYFFVVGPAGPLPPQPKPCEPARCRIITLSLANGKYMLTIEGDKTNITLNPVTLTDSFINALQKTPNQQYILTNPDFVNR